jgi:hypothetical protein
LWKSLQKTKITKSWQPEKAKQLKHHIRQYKVPYKHSNAAVLYSLFFQVYALPTLAGGGGGGCEATYNASKKAQSSLLLFPFHDFDKFLGVAHV